MPKPWFTSLEVTAKTIGLPTGSFVGLISHDQMLPVTATVIGSPDACRAWSVGPFDERAVAHADPDHDEKPKQRGAIAARIGRRPRDRRDARAPQNHEKHNREERHQNECDDPDRVLHSSLQDDELLLRRARRHVSSNTEISCPRELAGNKIRRSASRRNTLKEATRDDPVS